MRISIITATFNNISTIEDTINSVLSQSNSPFEYIIIDGASTDGAKEIISSYSSRISKFISEKDSGIYDALNKGIALATGDIIGFLHADDTYANPEILSKVSAAFAPSPDIWAVYGDLQFVSKQQPTRVIRNWKSKPFNKSLLARGWMPPHPALFMKKEVYRKFGQFDVSYKIAADYDFILRVFSQPGFNAVYVPEVLVKMKMGGVSTGNIRNLIRKSREDYQILRRNKVGNIFTLLHKIFSKFNQFYT
jgi:glycosyltransferase involved in cell wall biosynthesis